MEVQQFGNSISWERVGGWRQRWLFSSRVSLPGEELHNSPVTCWCVYTRHSKRQQAVLWENFPPHPPLQTFKKLDDGQLYKWAALPSKTFVKVQIMRSSTWQDLWHYSNSFVICPLLPTDQYKYPLRVSEAVWSISFVGITQLFLSAVPTPPSKSPTSWHLARSLEARQP